MSFCAAKGNVKGENDSYYVGGLVGDMFETEICFSSASGNVTGGHSVGGLVGMNWMAYHQGIKNCYASGNVQGIDWVGGLVGMWSNIPYQTNCYAAGRVSAAPGAEYVGGFVGRSGGFPNPDYQCYFLAQEDLSDSVALPLTDAQMKQQAGFVGWDFVGEQTNGRNEIWRMCTDGVDDPRLSWEFGRVGDFACPDGVGMDDLETLALHWLTADSDPDFNYAADGSGDGVINQQEMEILSKHWKE